MSGIAAALLTLNPTLSPDQVKGALMLKARALRKVTNRAAGVGEAYAPGAASVQSPPNPNRALDAFLVEDPEGDGLASRRRLLARRGQGVAELGRRLLARRLLVGRGLVAGLLVGTSPGSDVSWSDVSWSDVSWADVSWLGCVLG